MASIVKVHHPYVKKVPGVCGGEPVIAETRFPVRSVVVYILHQGMTPEEMVAQWDYLSLAQIYDALSYYYDHKEEIDKSIEQNREDYMKEKLKEWEVDLKT